MASRAMTRRTILKNIAAAALAGPLAMDAAQMVHEAAARQTASTGGVYNPKALNANEFATLRNLCELIVPGAAKGGAAEFIDLLASQNAEMAAIYTGGLAWLDRAMQHQFNATFLTAAAQDRTAMLDKIAFRANRTPELAAGIRVFTSARR